MRAVIDLYKRNPGPQGGHTRVDHLWSGDLPYIPRAGEDFQLGVRYKGRVYLMRVIETVAFLPTPDSEGYMLVKVVAD